MELEAIATASSPLPSPPQRMRGCRRRGRGWTKALMRSQRLWKLPRKRVLLRPRKMPWPRALRSSRSAIQYQSRLPSWNRLHRLHPRQLQCPPRRHSRRRRQPGSLPEHPGAKRSSAMTRWTSSRLRPRQFQHKLHLLWTPRRRHRLASLCRVPQSSPRCLQRQSRLSSRRRSRLK